MSNESEDSLDVERMIAEERSIREIGYARYWNRKAAKLVGKKIVEARYLTQQDLENMGFRLLTRSLRRQPQAVEHLKPFFNPEVCPCFSP